MTFLLKLYSVSTHGFPVYFYEAESPGKARAKAWRSYSECRDCSFKDFLKISRVSKAATSGDFGKAITVSGRPAHYVGWNGQYVRFTRPDSTEILCSHPRDVAGLAGKP